MKTIEQIKAEILASNPSRKYIINDEEFEQTEAEFQEAVQKRAEMEFEQQQHIAAMAETKKAKVTGYQKLGLSDAEIIAIVALSEDEAEMLLG